MSPRFEPQLTVYVSIGNSDDKLGQTEWSSFASAVLGELFDHARRIHGVWWSGPDMAYQNACFCADIDADEELVLKYKLAQMCRRYRQDSIAWASVPAVTMITPGLLVERDRSPEPVTVQLVEPPAAA